MSWAAAWPVQCVVEEQIFVFGSFWIFVGWLDNCNLVWREDTLTKCIFTIPLFEGATVFKCHSEDEAYSIGLKDWCILPQFRPDAIFIVAQDDYLRLFAE
jgi:hypothetical protein